MDLISGNRIKEAPWRLQEPVDVILGGAGGISSWVALFLSRVNVDSLIHLHIYDFDKVEIHNVGGQLFSPTQVNKPKVSAVQTNVEYLCGSTSNLYTYNEPYTEKTLASSIVIGGFDNMEARKILFLNWEKEVTALKTTEHPPKYSPLLIDGRLTAEQIQIFCVTPENSKRYQKDFLFSDKSVADTPCTFKQTSHVAAMMGSLITNFFLSHINNCNEGIVSRDIPFFYEYFMPINYLNIVP